MLASLSKETVSGPEWVYEEKYDGIRAVAYRDGDRVRLLSRTGQDLTAGFPAIVGAIRNLPDPDFVLDGELVVFDESGVSRFQLLQRRGIDRGTRTLYVVFDCLRSKGRDLLRRPLEERRGRLLELVPKRAGPLMPSRRLPRVCGATWVKPRLVAQLVYAEWTADGKLRQPAFLGLRTDKKPEECTWARRE